MANIRPIETKDKWIVDDSGQVVGVQLAKEGNPTTFANVSATVNPLTRRIELSAGGADLSTIAMRRTPVRVATFGDSTANFNTTNTDAGFYTAPFPASGLTTAQWDTGKLAVYQFYPQCKVIANGGVSGETTTQMLARDNAGASSTRKAINDVINLAPDVVLLRGGSINNLTPITAGNYDATIATTYSEHCRIINRFLAAGVAVIDEGVHGYSGVIATYPDLVRSALVTLNAQIKQYIASIDRSDCIWLGGNLCDAVGNYLPNVSYDGVHLNYNGSLRISKLEAAALTAMFGASYGPRFPGQNLISNPLFASVTAQGYGSMATGYAVTGTNCTLSNAKQEVIDGAVWQTVDVTPTASGSSISLSIPFDVTTFGIAANDIFGAEVDLCISDLTGTGSPPTPTGFYVRNDFYKLGAGRFAPAEGPVGPVLSPVDGPLRQHSQLIYQVQEPSSNLTASSNWQVFYSTSALTPYKVGICHPRLVKLGQTMLTS